ncbi:MAG: RNA methyltransferase [Oscillatoria princeps RMCB-10]|jgi:tRNA/rRNA methyltransferase|nr:RNA methyltransferase [Oscillatoria princeps RMCB-10]
MNQAALERVRIVLVEPAGPLNVGATARVMKNMGLHRLVLVSPHCDPQGEDARKMAVHAADILQAAEVVDSLPAALQGCQRAMATTGRERSSPAPLEDPRDSLSWLLEAPAALIFGPEDRGLSNLELKYAQRLIRIRASDAYPSLNLAQAVAICCYELYQLSCGTPNRAPSTGEIPPSAAPAPAAPLDLLEGYYQHLEALLLRIGYLYPHTAESRMEKFRRLFNRAGLSASEVAMLRGILAQVEWALSQQRFADHTLKASGDSPAGTPICPDTAPEPPEQQRNA